MTVAVEALGEFLDRQVGPEYEHGLDVRTLRALSLFDEIAPIPSPTGHEEALAKYLEFMGRDSGFETLRDEVGNLAILVPATPGFEDAPGVCIQTHLDGVPKAEPGKPNPAEHGVRPVLKEMDGELCLATDGTTLWADNRAGIAAGLAIAMDPASVHPKLMLLYTVGEEKDMRGAVKFGIPFDPEAYPVMWNFDAEDLGVVVVGSAAAGYTDLTVPLARSEVANRAFLRIEVAGTPDNRHSGLDIHRGRANANKVLAEVLAQVLDQGFDVRLVDLGDDNYEETVGEPKVVKNAICRSAQATVAVKPEDLKIVTEILGRASQLKTHEYDATDPELSINLVNVVPSDELSNALMPDSTTNAVNAILALPHGVIEHVEGHPEQVLTSTNLAVAHIGRQDAHLTLSLMSRAARAEDVDLVRHDIANRMFYLADTLTQSPVLKGWTATDSAGMVEFLGQVYENLFGEPLRQVVYHAGLETGEFQDRFPGLDITSIGPTIRGPHGTQEHMSIEKYNRFVTFAFAIAEVLARASVPPERQ